jgi:hypothetical protein
MDRKPEKTASAGKNAPIPFFIFPSAANSTIDGFNTVKPQHR